jgi:hypothetical protein
MTPGRAHALIPLDIFGAGLSYYATAVWACLRKYADPKNGFSCVIGYAVILRHLPFLDRRNLQRSLKQLEDRRLLKITPRADRTGASLPHRYKLFLPPVKIFSSVDEREKCARGGVSRDAGRASLETPEVLPLRPLTYCALKSQRRGKAAFGRPPLGLSAKETQNNINGDERNRPSFQGSRAADRETRPRAFNTQKNGISGDFEEAWLYIKRTYERKRGVPIPEPGRRREILMNVLRIYQLEGVKALWDLWLTDERARGEGFSFEYFDRSIDRLLGAEEKYKALRRHHCQAVKP